MFPTFVRLAAHGFDAGRQDFRLSVVNGRDDADERPIREARDVRSEVRKRSVIQPVLLNPARVRGRLILDTLAPKGVLNRASWTRLPEAPDSAAQKTIAVVARPRPFQHQIAEGASAWPTDRIQRASSC